MNLSMTSRDSVIAIAITLGCAFLVFGCKPPRNDAEEELQIQRAVLRYQFEHNAAVGKYTIFCIAITDDKKSVDAPATLIASLNDARHKVLGASACDGNDGNGVTEHASGKPALMLNVGAVTWEADDEAVVNGGYFEAGLSASGNTYQLKKIAGQWQVVKDEMNWIA